MQAQWQAQEKRKDVAATSHADPIAALAAAVADQKFQFERFGYFVADRKDHATSELLYASPQVETLLGFTPEEWAASPDFWLERVHPDDRERVERSDRSVEGDQWVEDYRTTAKDGRIVWIHNDAVLVRDEDGRPQFWLGVVVDMSERMEAEERLREEVEEENHQGDGEGHRQQNSKASQKIASH